VRDLIASAHELQGYLELQQWPFCFIGGLAVFRWGERRLTVDADVTLLTGFGEEDAYADILLRRYASRIPDPIDFVVKNRVLLLYLDNQVSGDIAFGGLPYEEDVVRRSSLHEYDTGVELRTCSAEDLVVMKAIASRPRDWQDIEGILIRQAGRLDWTLVLDELSPLAELKEDPAIVPRLLNRRKALETG
jgi:hypothetical protein